MKKKPISAKRRAQLRAAQKRYRLAHPEKCRERQTAWRDKNPDKVRAKRERYNTKHRDRLLADKRAKRKEERATNPDKIRAYMRDYYARTKERHSERAKGYYEKDRENVKARVKRYREKNHDKCLERERAWKRAHPDAWKRWAERNPGLVAATRSRRRARKANAPVNDFTGEQWIALQESYGHRCAYCNECFPGKLTQDHIVPLSKGGPNTLSNVVPACAWCNTSKGNRAKPYPKPKA